MAPRGTFRLFRVAGIDLFLHWSWFLMALFEIQARAGAYSTPGWNVLEYVSLFAIVTLHEFGHALACRSVGGTPDRIMLWPFGGVAFVDPPQRAGAVLWSIAAGPLVNVALLAPLWLLAHSPLAAVGNFGTYLRAVEWINGGLLLFNVLPIYPLDGGQILRALLWFPMGRARSLTAATVVGLVGLALAVPFVIKSGDIWLMAIGAYVALNCWNGFRQARALARIARIPRRPGFECPSCRTSPPLGEYWQCGRCGRRFDTFATGAACPHCAAQFGQTACLDCGRVNPIAAWTDAIVVTAR